MGKLPRFHSAAGKLFDRAPFLDGTYHAYFVPEQWPWGMTEVPHIGYVTPLHWPKAGYLLRPPQVVCISFDVYPDQWDMPDVGVAYAYADKFQGFDYLQVAIDVKIAIEAIRPNRTFVGMTSYSSLFTTGYWGAHTHPFNANPRDPIYPQSLEYYNSYFNFNYQAGPGTYLNYLVAPNPSEDFFGVDFLHLYVNNEPNFEGPGLPHDPMSVTGPYYAPGKARVIGSHPKFARFNVTMYSMPWMVVGFYTIPPPSGAMQSVCSELADYGYSYGGDAQTELTVAGLTDVIARHFNFHPVTGKDLPVT